MFRMILKINFLVDVFTSMKSRRRTNQNTDVGCDQESKKKAARCFLYKEALITTLLSSFVDNTALVKQKHCLVVS